jgi:hypothetical protein
MDEEEKIKKEFEELQRIVNAINKNILKYGDFDVWLNDDSIINGTQFEIVSYGKDTYIKIMHNYKECAKINVKSIKYIAPEFYVVNQQAFR